MRIRLNRLITHLEAIKRFYCHDLGFDIKQEQSSQLLLRHRKFCPQFELFFQEVSSDSIKQPFTPEHLIVFYLPEPVLRKQYHTSISNTGLKSVPSFNPYWDGCGVTYEDPDGYSVNYYHDVAFVSQDFFKHSKDSNPDLSQEDDDKTHELQ